MLTLLLAIVLHLIRLARNLSRKPAYRRSPCQARPVRRARRKPEWVRQEVIRLKALMPETGTCRVIETLFNRRFARKRNMTVGRTFVSEVIRDHRHEIAAERRRIKNARPAPVPRNLVWGLDLTGHFNGLALTYAKRLKSSPNSPMGSASGGVPNVVEG